MFKFLENIFSIKKNGDCKIVKLFGLKIFESKTESLRKEDSYEMRKKALIKWRYEDANTFAEYCNKVSENLKSWENVRPGFWMMYISALCEAKKFKQAQKLLKKYIKLHGYFKIHNFLLVAKLAKSIGMVDENIEKSVFVLSRLEENNKNKVFEKLIKGKSVAIVGNGPSELGKSKGEEIDSHDIVMRFNNYQIKGFEKDYGSKINVWARGLAKDLIDRDEENGHSCCLWIMNIYRVEIRDEPLDALYRSLKKGHIQQVCLSTEECADFKNIARQTWPTTGLIAINNVLKCKSRNGEKFSINDIYGFSFLQEIQMKDCRHYFNDRSEEESIERSKSHNLALESEMLKKLFKIDNGKKQ